MSIPAFRTKGEWIDRSRAGVLKDQQEQAVGKTILDIGVALPCLRIWIQSRTCFKPLPKQPTAFLSKFSDQKAELSSSTHQAICEPDFRTKAAGFKGLDRIDRLVQTKGFTGHKTPKLHTFGPAEINLDGN